MSEVISADMIRRALEETYRAPEWYLGFEVGNSCGADSKRHADAVAVNAYPSKGFETRGFEIKVSKADLKSELENGIKSDEVARFCDYWFLITPPGLFVNFTLPPTWGVIELKDGKLRQKVRAQKLNKTQPTPGFLCAMLRGRERLIAAAARNIAAEREDQIRREAVYRAGNAEKDLKTLYAKLEEIRAATGIKLDTWEPAQGIVDRLNAAHALGNIARDARMIDRRAKQLLQDAQEIQQAAAMMLKVDCEEANHDG